jgi:tripeptidyl-peptidase-1
VLVDSHLCKGIPDVSAQADHYRFFYKGRAFLIGGTSAAAPAFAGFVALLNDARIKAGKGPLGFLNPLLYTFGLHGLNDITSGNNAGCGTTGFNVSIEY